MARANSMIVILVLICTAWCSLLARAQVSGGPVVASGTINIVLSNKNGFVIAADSRMSSDKLFDCNGRQRLYCDNSQKLFRTGRNSAVVIAGFAVGLAHSPLDLTVASVLRKKFGPQGIPGQLGEIPFASDWIQSALQQALTGVAALDDPETTLPESLGLTATFAGFDKNKQPILKQLFFRESWKPAGPLNVKAPDYEVISGSAAPAGKFVPVTAGISCVANAILDGYYKTADPVIQRYYQKRHEQKLDSISLAEMKSLALVILRETRKFTDKVGGEDQIGVFPVDDNVQWFLPPLPVDKELPARFYLWKGLECAEKVPQCNSVNGRSVFFMDPQDALDEPIAKFFLAGQFRNIPVALDNNYFINDSFDGTTLKWRGGRFYMHSINFKNCVVELPEGAQLPSNSELNGKCQLVRKSDISVPPNTVGLPIKVKTSDCITNNPDGTVSLTAGGSCGDAAGIIFPPSQP